MEDVVLGGEVPMSTTKCSIEGSTYSDEENAAYLYACENDITTIRNINDARLQDPLTRAELAKMLTQYTVSHVDKRPDTTKDCSLFNMSTAHYTDDLPGYMTLSCQLSIMGVHPDYTPLSDFMPDKTVSRAEFGTVFSRILRGDIHEGTDQAWYQKHLAALKEAKIMTDITPDLTELRGWVFLMMYRSTQQEPTPRV